MKKHLLFVLFLLLGAGICIGAEFALDKTDLSHILIYAVMIIALACMAGLVLHAVFRRDTLK